MFKKSFEETPTLIVCEVQPGRTRTVRQCSNPVTMETSLSVQALVLTASALSWNVILLEDASRPQTFAPIRAALPNHRRNQTVCSHFDDAERGIVLNDCEKVEYALRWNRIMLCGATASVHEVAATLFILPEQSLDIIQQGCTTKICRKEIMRQRRRSGRNLATGFQIKPWIFQ